MSCLKALSGCAPLPYRHRNFQKSRGARDNGGVTMEAHMPRSKSISRRAFLTKAATTAAAFTIVPRHVLGRGFAPPSDTLNIAGVGVGGMGRANLVNLASQNIVALCDVDWGYADKGFGRLDLDIERLKKRIELPAPAQP